MICVRELDALARRLVLSNFLRNVSTFSSQRKVLQKNRAAGFDNHAQYDYIKDGIAEILTGFYLNTRIFIACLSVARIPTQIAPLTGSLVRPAPLDL